VASGIEPLSERIEIIDAEFAKFHHIKPRTKIPKRFFMKHSFN